MREWHLLCCYNNQLYEKNRRFFNIISWEPSNLASLRHLRSVTADYSWINATWLARFLHQAKTGFTLHFNKVKWVQYLSSNANHGKNKNIKLCLFHTLFISHYFTVEQISSWFCTTLKTKWMSLPAGANLIFWKSKAKGHCRWRGHEPKLERVLDRSIRAFLPGLLRMERLAREMSAVTRVMVILGRRRSSRRQLWL